MPKWLDDLLNRKKEAVMPDEVVEETKVTRLIPDETHKVIQQAIDGITDYIVREAQKLASEEGHPLEISPQNVIDVINKGEISVRVHMDSEHNP